MLMRKRCCREPHLPHQRLQHTQKLLRLMSFTESKQLRRLLPMQCPLSRQMLPALMRLLSNTLTLIPALSQTSTIALRLPLLPTLALHQTGRSVH